MDPIFFVNNIFEQVQHRYLDNKVYNSFDGIKYTTMDGVQKCNEAIELLTKKNKTHMLELSPSLCDAAFKICEKHDYNTLEERE